MALEDENIHWTSVADDPEPDSIHAVRALIDDQELAGSLDFTSTIQVEDLDGEIRVRPQSLDGDAIGHDKLRFLLWRHVLDMEDPAIYGALHEDPVQNQQVYEALCDRWGDRSCVVGISGKEAKQGIKHFWGDVHTMSQYAFQKKETLREPLEDPRVEVEVCEEIFLEDEDWEAHKKSFRHAIATFDWACEQMRDQIRVLQNKIEPDMGESPRRLVDRQIRSVEAQIRNFQRTMKRLHHLRFERFQVRRRLKQHFSTESAYEDHLNSIAERHPDRWEQVDVSGKPYFRVAIHEDGKSRRLYPLSQLISRSGKNGDQELLAFKLSQMSPFSQYRPDATQVLDPEAVHSFQAIHYPYAQHFLEGPTRDPHKDLHAVLVGDTDLFGEGGDDAPYRSLLLPLMSALFPKMDFRLPEKRLLDGPRYMTPETRHNHDQLIESLLENEAVSLEKVRAEDVAKISDLHQIHADPHWNAQWDLNEGEVHLLLNIMNGRGQITPEYEAVILKVFRRYRDIVGYGGVLIYDVFQPADEGSRDVIKQLSQDEAPGKPVIVFATPDIRQERTIDMAFIEQRLLSASDHPTPDEVEELGQWVQLLGQQRDYAASREILRQLVTRYFVSEEQFMECLEELLDAREQGHSPRIDSSLVPLIQAILPGFLKQGLTALEEQDREGAETSVQLALLMQAYLMMALDPGQGLDSEDDFVQFVAAHHDSILMVLANEAYVRPEPSDDEIEEGELTSEDFFKMLLEDYRAGVGSHRMKLLARSPSAGYALMLQHYKQVLKTAHSEEEETHLKRAISVASYYYEYSINSFKSAYDTADGVTGLLDPPEIGVQGFAPVEFLETEPRIKLEVLRLGIHAADRLCQLRHAACEEFRKKGTSFEDPECSSAIQAYQEAQRQYGWMSGAFETMVDEGAFVPTARLLSYYLTRGHFSDGIAKNYREAMQYYEKAEKLALDEGGMERDIRRIQLHRAELLRVRVEDRLKAFRDYPAEIPAEPALSLKGYYNDLFTAIMLTRMIGEEEDYPYYEVQYKMTWLQDLTDFLAFDELISGNRTDDLDYEKMSPSLAAGGRMLRFEDIFPDDVAMLGMLQQASSEALELVRAQGSPWKGIAQMIHGHIMDRLEYFRDGSDERCAAMEECADEWMGLVDEWGGA